MLIAVVILFIVCWGPKLILEVIKKYTINSQVNLFNDHGWAMQIMKEILPVVHSCFNPYVYCFMSRNFRYSMQRAFRKCFQNEATRRRLRSIEIVSSLKSSRSSASRSMSTKLSCSEGAKHGSTSQRCHQMNVIDSTAAAV